MGMSEWDNTSWAGSEVAQRTSAPPISIDEWASWFGYGGSAYQVMQTYSASPTEEITPQFESVVQRAFKSNGVIFACMVARMLLFSEARFQFQEMRNGRPGNLFGTPALARLERPSPGMTTGDLLSRMIQDADLAGNWYGARRPNERLKRLRPDWVTIVLGSDDPADEDMTADDIDAEVVGYIYHPGGRYSQRKPEFLLPNTVAHYHPIPDPEARFRGMSWVTPIIREVMADGAATTHKLKFFENGATPNMVVTLDASIRGEAFKEWITTFESGHKGHLNAYKTLYLGGGADAKVVGADMHQLDFKLVQGAGETRIAAAAGVPPVIVGLSEGLQAATYSNYGQARRRLADGTIRPLWRNAAGSVEPIIDTPSGSRLWYDDRDIPFLKEDVKDAAGIAKEEASTIRTLLDAGFKPETVIDAVGAADWTRLEHTGLFSVQLQPPGSKVEQPAEPAPDAQRSEDGGPVRCQSCGKSRFVVQSLTPLRLKCIRCDGVTEAAA